MINSPVSY